MCFSKARWVKVDNDLYQKVVKDIDNTVVAVFSLKRETRFGSFHLWIDGSYYKDTGREIQCAKTYVKKIVDNILKMRGYNGKELRASIVLGECNDA